MFPQHNLNSWSGLLAEKYVPNSQSVPPDTWISGLKHQWGRGPICPPPPPQNIVPQKRAVSVAMDGPILFRILCSLMPISQLFCEKVAL
jgi:hypothetical protein